MFRLGYNTNGLPHHRVEDALGLCAELGYKAVALTPDAGLLDPYRLGVDEVQRVRKEALALGLSLSVETGSRFLLDPRRKHFPTLLEEEESDRARRVDFLCRCIDLALDLGAECLSFWAGAAPDQRHAEAGARAEDWDRLVAGTQQVLVHGREQGIALTFEPEPGMFIERPAGYLALLERLGNDGADLKLCLDVGHCLVTGDLPVGQVIRDLAPHLGMVHLDDIAGGQHIHRMFGEGDLDLRETLGALRDAEYSGIAAVELSRDGHRGASAAKEAMEHLQEALDRP